MSSTNPPDPDRAVAEIIASLGDQDGQLSVAPRCYYFGYYTFAVHWRNKHGKTIRRIVSTKQATPDAAEVVRARVQAILEGRT